MFITPQRSRSHQCFIVSAVVLAIACYCAPVALAQDISWARYESDCPDAAAQASLTVPAGRYGVFYFGAQQFTSCPDLRVAGCVEQPRIYPPPGPSRMDGLLACDPSSSGCGKKFSDMTTPWVAVVDWDDWHGRSVDKLIRDSTDPVIDTMLIPLEDHFQKYRNVITDADVLIHFAELVESIDRRGTPKPLVVNMSFGRLHEPGDARDATCDQTVCGPGALSCQLARLLEYVTREEIDQPKTVVVASRGNDLLELGPGELDEVVSVGMMDLTELADGADVAAAWESPPKYDALMPGGGFCLRLQGIGPPDLIETVLPTGSSYSAALFSGILAEQLWHDPRTVQNRLRRGPLWIPRNHCFDNGCPFFLSHDGTDFPLLSGRGSALITEIATGDVSSCGTLPGGMGYLAADLLPVRSAGPYRHPTLPELTAGTHRPTPETNGCVPCGGSSQVRGAVPANMKVLRGAVSNNSRRATPSNKPGRTSTKLDLIIDMHTGWYFHRLSLGLTLRELYLRVGQELRLVELRPTDLDDIADGNVAKLQLTGTFQTLDLSVQPSLVFVITRPGKDANQEEWFWKSAPIYLKPSP